MAGEKTEPTTEEKVAALHDSVSDLHKKFDAFMSKHAKKDDDDDDRKDAKKDNEEEDEGDHDKDGEPKKDAKKDDDDDDDDRRKDAKKDAEGKDIEEWAKEEKKEPEHKDAKKDDKKDADPDAAPEEKGEPKAMASDDDRRKDDDDHGRKDSVEFRRRLDRLERSRVRSDAELNALADAQQEWDRVAQQFGERAHRPLDGETLNTFNRRHVVRFQKHSPRWKDMDFSQLPASVMQVAMPDVRADSIEAAKRGLIGQPELREIVRYDRTGRKISEFIGDIAVTLAPFRLPSMRVKGGRINTRPNEY
jgi:hypothetical protein